jgi:hypothetical protein
VDWRDPGYVCKVIVSILLDSYHTSGQTYS